jgi:hypothetical protein
MRAGFRPLLTTQRESDTLRGEAEQFVVRASVVASVYLLVFIVLSSATFAQSYLTGKVFEVGAMRPKGSQQ